MKVSINVKIAMQCFENFGGGQMLPLVARLVCLMLANLYQGRNSLFCDSVKSADFYPTNRYAYCLPF